MSCSFKMATGLRQGTYKMNSIAVAHRARRNSSMEPRLKQRWELNPAIISTFATFCSVPVADILFQHGAEDTSYSGEAEEVPSPNRTSHSDILVGYPHQQLDWKRETFILLFVFGFPDDSLMTGSKTPERDIQARGSWGSSERRFRIGPKEEKTSWTTPPPRISTFSGTCAPIVWLKLSINRKKAH